MLSRDAISEAPISADPVGSSSRSFTVQPSAVYTGMAVSHTLQLVGSLTDWLTSTPSFSVGVPLNKVSPFQTISDNTHATVTVTSGSVGNSVIGDGFTTATVQVGLPIITPAPSTILVGSTGNVIALTGQFTLWQTDNPTFTVTGGVGPSITFQSIIGQTSATVTVSAGSSVGTLTIHDPTSGATCNITVSTSAVAKTVDLVSPFGAYDPVPTAYLLKKYNVGGSLISDGGTVTTGITDSVGDGKANHYCAQATVTLDADGGYRGLVVWNNATPTYMAEEINIPPAPIGGGSGPAGHSGALSITLVDSAGNPRGSLTGLRWAWFDQARPDLFSRPTETGSGQTTNVSGVFTIALTNTTLGSGQVGFLVVSDTDGTTGFAHKAFSGPVALS